MMQNIAVLTDIPAPMIATPGVNCEAIVILPAAFMSLCGCERVSRYWAGTSVDDSHPVIIL
jgi:hypothetical protein